MYIILVAILGVAAVEQRSPNRYVAGLVQVGVLGVPVVDVPCFHASPSHPDIEGLVLAYHAPGLSCRMGDRHAAVGCESLERGNHGLSELVASI